jgi:4-aminobutyrate aminotransferase-like enzyme
MNTLVSEEKCSLQADQFKGSPKVRHAIDTILGELGAAQVNLAPREADSALESAYSESLQRFADARGGGLFFPYIGSGIGRGPLVELANGQVVYDMITGIGAFPAGHSDPRIMRAQLEAALSDLVIQGNLQQNRESAQFVETLVKAASAQGAELKHCFLSTTGVMAGENSLKIALQKHAPAHRVLAFENCFAGRTIAFSQITDKPAFRDGLPENMAVDYVPFYDVSDPVGSTERALKTLKTHLSRHPGQYAAMFFELIQGEGGFNVGSTEFFKALMTCCREAGVAVLVDEVQTFARTESLFAFQHFGLDALVDVVWIGKASQVCATLYRPEYKPRPGLLSQTFTGSTAALRAGQVIIDTLLTESYYGADGRLAKLHCMFVNAIQSISDRTGGRLKGPYGIGAMWAFTLDAGDPAATKAFIQHLFQHGVLSFVAGKQPAKVRFLPPFLALTDADLDAVFTRIEAALNSFETPAMEVAAG